MKVVTDAPEMHAGYDPAVYAALLAVEDRHFWFRARNRAIQAAFESVHPGLPAGYRVLEVGCGTGNVLRTLDASAAGGIVVGMDLFQEGLQAARRRVDHALLVRADANHPPFSVRFEVVGLFDVLEHLDDDVEALRGLRHLVADRGVLILTVPAGPTLWSYFDVASHHRRRYTAGQLRSALSEGGFTVEYLTPYMAVLHPLIWLGRRFTAWRSARIASPADAWQVAQADLHVRPVTGAVLEFLLRQELRLLKRRRRLPIGASLLAVARPA